MVISPLSLTIALGMLAGGAGLSQREEYCSKLGIDDPANLSEAFGQTQTLLRSINEQRLEIANAVFAENSFNFKVTYRDFLAAFAAEFAQFPNLPDATDKINGWISHHTLGLIQNMLDRKSLEGAEVVLVNALAFKGTWETKFNSKETQNGYTFLISATETRPVDMMFRYRQNVHVFRHESYTAVSLPYKAASGDRKIALRAYLPKVTKSVQDILGEIQAEAPSKFEFEKLTKFGFPKLKIGSTENMTGLLKQLGYPLEGTYPEMGSGAGNATINSILHRAFVKVDEEGTEAAAVTVVTRSRTMAVREDPNILIFDRPFAFSIEEDSGMVLFTGLFSTS